MAANATFALKAGVWVRRVRLLIVSPDSTGTACPLSGRNSTYRPVQISEAGSSGHRSSLTIFSAMLCGQPVQLRLDHSAHLQQRFMLHAAECSVIRRLHRNPELNPLLGI